MVMPVWWTERYGATPPLGHRLRTEHRDRWLRIHSLPGSQRYPADDAQRELLLDRHTTVADALLGTGQPCALLTVTWGRPVSAGERRWLDPRFGARPFVCVASEQDPETGSRAGYWLAWTPWEPEAARALLLAIADDQLRAVWMARATGEVYAPYDGGADLLVATPARRAELAARFAGWLSARPDGL